MATLVVQNGAKTGQAFELTKPSVSIGSAASCDIVIPDGGVMAEHATIFVRGEGRAYLRNHDANAPTYVNGRHVPSTAPVNDGATIRAGDINLLFTSAAVADIDSPPAPAPPVFDAAPAERPGSAAEAQHNAILDVLTEHEQSARAEKIKHTFFYNLTPVKLAIGGASLLALAVVGAMILRAIDPEAIAAKKGIDKENWKELVGKVMDDMEKNPEKYKDFKAKGDPEKVLMKLGMDPEKVKNFVVGRAFGSGAGGASGGSKTGSSSSSSAGGAGRTLDIEGGGNASITVKDGGGSGGGESESSSPSGGGGGGMGIRASGDGQADMHFENTAETDQSEKVAQGTKIGDESAKGDGTGAIPNIQGKGQLNVHDKNRAKGKDIAMPEDEGEGGDLEEALAGKTKEATNRRRRPAQAGESFAEPGCPADVLLAHLSPDARAAIAPAPLGGFVVGWIEGADAAWARWFPNAGVAEDAPNGLDAPAARAAIVELPGGRGARVFADERGVMVRLTQGDESETIEVSDEPGTHAAPAIASAGDGFVVAWEATDPATARTSMRWRAFATDGSPRGDTRSFAMETFRQAGPALASNDDGQVALAWIERPQYGIEARVRVQVLAPGGGAICDYKLPSINNKFVATKGHKK
ncbi:FHA domain-containing protein [bacterium]|nr:FHA domain-containing protein [bacterium]